MEISISTIIHRVLSEFDSSFINAVVRGTIVVLPVQRVFNADRNPFRGFLTEVRLLKMALFAIDLFNQLHHTLPIIIFVF